MSYENPVNPACAAAPADGCIGSWYTITDTSMFVFPKNRGTEQKGVFISIPISVFKDHEARGSFEHDITSFLRDPGQTVRTAKLTLPYESVGHAG